MDTQKKAAHSPLPWDRENGKVNSGNAYVGFLSDFTEEDADLVIRAVNSHDALRDVKTFARSLLKALDRRFQQTGCSDTEEMAIKCLEEAIAQAEGAK